MSEKPRSSLAQSLFSHTQIRHLMRVEFGRAQRYGYGLACLQIAVDRIDHLRDLYGYDAKEAILGDVVRLLQDNTRGCDYLGRSTDDRLMAVLPHTDEAGSRSAAQRLLEAARRIDFQAEGRRVQVSLSIGASDFTDENTLFFDALVDSSSAALAAAVEAGGDRFEYRSPGAV